jgi:periplasmic copper chaperone A
MNRAHRSRSFVALLAAALLLAACGRSDDPEPAAADGLGEDAGLVITDARSRMSPRMAGVAAVYLDIQNLTGSDDTLVSASVSPDIAGTVEIHESFEVDEVDAAEAGAGHGEGSGDGQMGEGTEGMHGDDGAPMMAMREIPAIDIPAGGSVELAPGGLHIMLLDLVDDLAPGDRFELTLTFEGAGDVTITVEVRDHV